MNRIIGIPSDDPETSDNASFHFGHCIYFVGIEIYDGGHSACMEPVINMKQRNITDMILTGIGMRPFMDFQQVNINLFQGIQGSIEKNIKMLLEGQLRSLNSSSCGNNSKHAHAH